MNVNKQVFWRYILFLLIIYPMTFSQQIIAAGETGGFNQVYELYGVTFNVESPNQGSINQLEITPAGLEIDNAVIRQEIDGTITGAEVADLNGDGSPEIYIYVNSAGSGAYGSLVAYSANNNKSLSAIYLPPLMDDKAKSNGYMGHDEFAVGEGILIRRFPVYLKGDTNANPTGGTRQLQYKLVQGEASWVLELDKSITDQVPVPVL